MEMIKAFILGKIFKIKSPSLVFQGLKNDTVWDCYKYNKKQYRKANKKS